MKEKNRAEEWFRAKHDELAETAQANLAAHDLEPGQEAYHLDSLHYATPGPDKASPWHGGHVSPTGNGARHQCRAHPEDFLLTGRLTP